MKKSLIFLSIFCLLLNSCKSESNDWVTLFDGKSLDGWEMKIAGYEFNNNYKNTFGVGDGTIKVSYDEYDSFDREFGHLFYTKKKFKNYHLKLDYKFYGEHIRNESWSYKNSGVMLHSEDPKQMFIDQGFPVSVEAQFLGGSGEGDRPTLNMCSPGTEVNINTSNYNIEPRFKATMHCINSNSKTYHKDDWVSVDLVVYSDSIIHHIIGKDTVISYTNIKFGGTYLSDNFTDKVGEPLKEGYLSLQSEGHPIEFRNIMIKELD
jgi:hypothetical protein